MTQAPCARASSATTRPSQLARRSGAVLKLVRPSRANDQRARLEKVERPPARGSTSKSTKVCLKPTQAYKPFMKRRRSGSCFNASTTQRSINRKSPAWSGMACSETQLCSEYNH